MGGDPGVRTRTHRDDPELAMLWPLRVTVLSDSDRMAWPQRLVTVELSAFVLELQLSQPGDHTRTRFAAMCRVRRERLSVLLALVGMTGRSCETAPLARCRM